MFNSKCCNHTSLYVCVSVGVCVREKEREPPLLGSAEAHFWGSVCESRCMCL